MPKEILKEFEISGVGITFILESIAYKELKC